MSIRHLDQTDFKEGHAMQPLVYNVSALRNPKDRTVINIRDPMKCGAVASRVVPEAPGG